MSFWSIIESIFIGPLKLIFEIIFEFAYRFVGHPGLAIIFLSLMMNILVLPLYRRADAMQEESRDIEAKLNKGVTHIKKSFSGDERMMILQTYYRQNNYKPTNALNGSVSLLLEIPFFMAAYQFLSHLDILDGVSFGPIKDLGAPDGLIVIGSLSINLLPILMTLVNVISSAMYLKGFPLKTKIQLYGMAGFFLVFLYTSPSCLVFYWTLNNVFSLVKTIFYKIKNPQKVLTIMTAVIGLAALVFALFFYNGVSIKRKIFVAGIGVALLLPIIMAFINSKKKDVVKKATKAEPNRKLFWTGAILLTVLVGLFIPSTYIAASPQEYVDITYFHNPLWYIVNSVCLSAGTFIVWLGVFYWLANDSGKVIFDRLVWILSGVMLVNYLFFGTKLGVISSVLQYEGGMHFELSEQLINALVVVLVAAVMLFVIIKWSKIAIPLLLTIAIALGGMSGIKIATINTSVSQISTTENEFPNFSLSTKGKNVVVIMLDRAIGQYVPYIFNEKSELKEKFAGFTHYSNTISFGPKTNFGTPPLLGGYEYTPVEMNKRDKESLAKKHNEALKLMPTIFSDNGYHVTMCDPVYANYQWIPDLSLFNGMKNTKAFITKGRFDNIEGKKRVISNNLRNFFCFGIMKTLPVFLQPIAYDGGLYNQISPAKTDEVYNTQEIHSLTTATGIHPNFMTSYSVMTNMSEMTNISKDDKNTFLFLANDMTHDPILLQAPDYTPAGNVDNTEYDKENADKMIVDGKELKFTKMPQKSHYHANMAAMIQLGNWFDYLRENGVYDNTRIILVSDHGEYLNHFEEFLLGDSSSTLMNAEFYYPLLMVKDFGSTEFTTSKEFMTNADVPVLATKDIIKNPTNPFTGKPLTSDEKTAHDQYIIASMKWDITENNGNTFIPSMWIGVKDNIWDKDNWQVYKQPTVLKEHAAP